MIQACYCPFPLMLTQWHVYTFKVALSTSPFLPPAHQLTLLPSVALSVFDKLPHFLVPLVLRLFSYANQGQLLLQPLFTFCLMFICNQL